MRETLHHCSIQVTTRPVRQTADRAHSNPKHLQIIIGDLIHVTSSRYSHRPIQYRTVYERARHIHVLP